MPDARGRRQVAAVGRGVETGGEQHERPVALGQLDVFVGRWMTAGETVGDDALTIRASDVYEWLPGGFFLLHTAYGVIGETPVGGVEIIAYDVASDTLNTRFYDSFGNVTEHALVHETDGAWRWQGATTRCRAVFSDDGRTQTAHHERTDDATTWVPSMVVTLTKVP
jgi:hypothetical protein